MKLADDITYCGRVWTLRAGRFPPTYRHANAEVYKTGDHWHSQCQALGDWTQLDLYGGHPDPVTAIKHVHSVLGWTENPNGQAQLQTT
jgi:hypothetical protein